MATTRVITFGQSARQLGRRVGAAGAFQAQVDHGQQKTHATGGR
jgi:hypothetical protein